MAYLFNISFKYGQISAKQAGIWLVCDRKEMVKLSARNLKNFCYSCFSILSFYAILQSETVENHDSVLCAGTPEKKNTERLSLLTFKGVKDGS